MELRTIIKEELYKIAHDKIIVEDILGSGTLNEAVDFNAILQRVKNYAQKGLLTATVLAGLMSSPALSQSQKSQIKAIAGTEQGATNVGQSVTINPHVREEWNQFIDWISKNYPSGISDQGADPTAEIVAAYHQFNPASPITASNVKDFQADLKQYNEKWKTLQPNYHPQGGTLSAPSPVDNRIGSITSKEKYPVIVLGGRDFGTDVDAAIKFYATIKDNEPYIDPNLTPQQRFEKNQALRAAGKPIPTIGDMKRLASTASTTSPTTGSGVNTLATNK